MKKYIKNNKKKILNATLSLVVIVIILSLILCYYINKETDVDKFKNTVVAVIENIQSLDLKDNEYTLINFPDEKEIITKNGKIKSSTNKKYLEFTKGYIIIYDNNNYAFKLSNGSYCATKDYNDLNVNIDLYAECENYDVEYK